MEESQGEEDAWKRLYTLTFVNVLPCSLMQIKNIHVHMFAQPELPTPPPLSPPPPPGAVPFDQVMPRPPVQCFGNPASQAFAYQVTAKAEPG